MTTDPALLRDLELSNAPTPSAACRLQCRRPRPEGSDEFRKLYGEGWPLKVVYYGAPAEAGGPAGPR